MSIQIIEKKLEEDLKAMFESEKFQSKMNELKEVEDDEEYKFKVVVTTEWTDRDGEIIKADWIDFKNYMKNPVVLVDHSYKIESIVWKTLKIYQDGKKTIAEWVFAKGVEKAELIRTLYNQWFIKTVSIWFIPLRRDDEDRTIISKSEMLEFSFVAVPANPEALSLDGKVYQKCVDLWIIKEVTQEEIDTVYKKYREETNMSASELKAWSETDCSKLASVDRSPIQRNIKLLETKKDDWGQVEVTNANKTIAFLARMKNWEQWEIIDECWMSKRDISLKNWAFDIKKTKSAWEEQIDLKDIFNIIQDVRQDINLLKSQLKDFADDKAKQQKSEKIRELGKELQKSLSAFNAEAKSQK